MLHLRVSAVLILLVVFTAKSSQVPIYDLPVDPSVPIITLNYVGGVTELPRQNINPVLTVRADGSVTISDALGRSKDIETSISGEDVQELLRFSLKDQSFLDFNTVLTNRKFSGITIKNTGIGANSFFTPKYKTKLNKPICNT